MKKKILVIGLIVGIVAAVLGYLAQRPEVREQF